ncbi:hypothetical protein A9Q76_00215, partial [Arcobacter sp. 31_11_sub10_T18]
SARRQLALKLRVSSGSLNSASLKENTHCRNVIIFSSEDQSHRFIPSTRSEADLSIIREIERPIENGGNTVGYHKDGFQNVINRHPESMTAIAAWLSLVSDCRLADDFDQNNPHLIAHELQILNSIPDDLSEYGDVQMSWDIIENRDFIRAVFWLARSFYGACNLSKALKWFTYSNSLCDHYSHETEEYLEDLKLDKPTGTVGKWKSQWD